MRKLVLIGLSTVVAVGLGAAPAAAAVPPGIPPVRGCASLVGEVSLPGTTAHVTEATVVAATAADPEHCDVRGYVEPAVRFQLRLPTTTFGGRYVQYGCGGLCGEIALPAFPACGGRPGLDMAVAATDDGHIGYPPPLPTLDGIWGTGNRTARDDWFYRGPHVVSVAAKRLIAAFYGAPPARSYFVGCSTGGREGLLLAQRYPDDFDGVVAGASAYALGPLAGIYGAWVVRANTGPDGAPILTGDKLPVLHAAVMAACDGLDGLVDGQLEDPRDCRYDPVALRCPAADAADAADCLTGAQVAAAHRLYRGPLDPSGVRLYPGWQPYGSELGWNGWLVPAPPFGALASFLADGYLRHVGFPIGTPHSSVAELTFTLRDFHRLTPEGVRGNAMSLDLSRFRRSGGKLILWHGWSDQGIPPVGTLDYYHRLTQRDGGLAATQRYARVFMVPSMYHCGDGETLTSFDPFPELVRWVERGAAPAKVVAYKRDAQGEVVRSRPVFAYPLRARYDGTGSIDDAANFVPAPTTAPRTVIRWAGESLYHRPGPTAP